VIALGGIQKEVSRASGGADRLCGDMTNNTLVVEVGSELLLPTLHVRSGDVCIGMRLLGRIAVEERGEDDESRQWIVHGVPRSDGADEKVWGVREGALGVV